ncbi:predicted protein [Arabidopsis lyrata subsp. lyrata]|uniref:Predicted protein n=1 Tax=Arabidopsis lyrata subsp. lyrata TaxID=81972 RepID=D7KIH6_ARALL|nr:predicted protein [Arabidopsis lyrata subsp. lyrata]
MAFLERMEEYLQCSLPFLRFLYHKTPYMPILHRGTEREALLETEEKRCHRESKVLNVVVHIGRNQVRMKANSFSSSTAVACRKDDDKAKQTEESLRTVMYLSCWGPN